MASGEWRVANGEWRMANGEWRMADFYSPTNRQAPTRHSLFALFPRQYKHRLLAK